MTKSFFVSSILGENAINNISLMVNENQSSVNGQVLIELATEAKESGNFNKFETDFLAEHSNDKVYYYGYDETLSSRLSLVAVR